MGIQQTVPKKGHVKYNASKEEKEEFKKRQPDTCGCSKPLPTQQAAATKKIGRQRLYLSING